MWAIMLAIQIVCWYLVLRPDHPRVEPTVRAVWEQKTVIKTP